MFDVIHSNLTRQHGGLQVLEGLLDEEFDLLTKRRTDDIVNLEFSMHELLRQLAVERTELKEMMHGTRLAEYAQMLPEEEGASVKKLFTLIDAAEQRCARQAAQNAELSLALLDQSHELMTFLHNQVVPKTQVVYGRKGSFTNPRPQAAILNGRL